MNDTVKILYNYKYGAFIFPKEILNRFNIIHQSDKCMIDFSDKIRTNPVLIDFIEKFKEHKKVKADYKFLSDILAEDNKRIYQIYSHIEKINVIEVPKIAYEYGAILYSEYDGKETIEINKDKMLLIRVKKLLEKLSPFELEKEIKDEICELIDIMPHTICL